MTDLSPKNPYEKLKDWIKPENKKEPTEFVKRMRALDVRAKQRNVLWDSSEKGTYCRALHGELSRHGNTVIKNDKLVRKTK